MDGAVFERRSRVPQVDGQGVQEKGFEPLKPRFWNGYVFHSVTPANIVPLAGFEPAKARILSPAHIPVLLQRRILFWFLSYKARMRIYRTVLPKGVEPSLGRV